MFYLSDVDLDGGVVFGPDDSVAGGAAEQDTSGWTVQGSNHSPRTDRLHTGQYTKTFTSSSR